MPAIQPRRGLVLVVFLICIFFSITLLFRYRQHSPDFPGGVYDNLLADSNHIPTPVLKGDVIASKLGNETLKAELGRAAWKLFHTTMARFPDRPKEDESVALRSYIYLFARLYPCGECASHFRQILARFPPQVSSRSTAAAWACHVHNEVNKSLKKPLFDCSKIGDFYDCGCAEDDKPGEDKAGKPVTGEDGKGQTTAAPLHLEKEGLTKGG